MKNIFLHLIIFLGIMSSGAQTPPLVGPYLQSPTSSSIKVKWWTDSLSVSSGKVMYGTAPGALSQTAIDTTTTTKHTVSITGLSPDTKYYYAIYNDNTFVEGNDAEHWFKTFPAPGITKPLRAWVIGDFGKGNDKQARVRDAYEAYDTVGTDLWLWLGDNAYADGTEAEFLSKVFDSTYGYRNQMKHWAFEPSPGNHDYNSVSPIISPKPPLQHAGPYYDLVDVYQHGEAGGIPTGHELFYSFDYANAHFISLNTEVGNLFSAADDWTGVCLTGNFTGSPQTQWLIQDLQANTKPWVIVYFHQPPYTDGSHESGAFYEVYMRAMRKYFAPIWEQYGVDLVICGHTHVYERSYLVKGCYTESTDITSDNYLSTNNGIEAQGQAFVKYTQGFNANMGTVYVNNGNSGSSETGAGFNHPYMFSEYGCDTCCGSFVLDINGDRLDGRHINLRGEEIDHFTMFKVDGSSAIKEAKDDMGALQVIPNPFSKTTTLAFDLAAAGNVKVTLLDMNGRSVEVFAGLLQPGKQLISIDATKLQLAKGVYTVNVIAGTINRSQTIIHIE